MIQDASSMDRPIAKKGLLSKRNLILAGAVGLLLLLASFLLPSIRRWAQSETSVDISRIRIGKVSRGDLVRDVTAEGKVVAAFHPTLYSPVAGSAHLEVKAGTVVHVGQVLGSLKSPELESELAQQNSALISLQAELRRQQIQSQQTNLQNQHGVGLLEVELGAARRALARAEKSREEGILNAVDFELAKDSLQVAGLKLELAKKDAEFEKESLDFEVQTRRSNAERQLLAVNELQRKVDELTIRSPVDGLVSRVQVEPGEAVGANAPLITVVDLSAFDIEIAVAENYADEITSGTDAIITLDGMKYRGQVKSISPEVEGARVKGIVTFGDETPASLKQNQRVSTRLILETRKDVVKVPRGPFLESGGGRLAYVVEDGLAVSRPIKIGSLSVADVEIISGLEIGEEIILSDITRFDGAQKILIRK